MYISISGGAQKHLDRCAVPQACCRTGTYVDMYGIYLCSYYT